VKPITFFGQTHVIAENQPQYLPLPAHIDDTTGTMTFCWSLSLVERLQVLFSGRVWHQVLTFGKPLQPQRFVATRPQL
jgi:hypothetical protein